LNSHSAWRLELARELAEIIGVRAGVRAILVVGSVARDWADEYSDLEMAVFWEERPPDEERLALIAALGGQLLYEYDGPADEDQLLIGGFQVDLWQNCVADEEALFDAVLGDYRMDLGASNFLDSVRHGIPVYGEELIAAWKAKAAHYPRELAIRSVREQLPAFHPGYLEVLARRGALPAFYAQVISSQQAIFLTLLALNREYFPAFKWMLPRLEQMQIKPMDVAERFRRIVSSPMDYAALEMTALLGETLQLVEAHLPEVDTSPARQRLAYHRGIFTRPPEPGQRQSQS
jgi:predicted nucleotidyltransferase